MNFLIRIPKAWYVILVFVVISVSFFWVQKGSERVLKLRDTENEELYAASKDHFNFVWYDGQNQLYKNYTVDSIDKQMIITGEKQYRKLLAMFEVNRISEVTVYVKPSGQEEEFKYVTGFQKEGDVYLRRVDMGGMLQHELVHVFVYRVIEEGYGYTPSWFQEGIAQYYSRGESELGSQTIRNFIVSENARRPVERTETGGLHKRSDLDPAVYFKLSAFEELKRGREQAVEFYAIALQLIEYLVRTKGGEEKLKELLLAMKKSHSFEVGFESVYEMTPYDLWNSWNSYR